MSVKIDLLTIFPGMLKGPFAESMIKRAVDRGLLEVNPVDLRAYAGGRHRQVDDAPYGGGCGMVLKPEPLFEAVEDLKARAGGRESWVILLSPRGRLFRQEVAVELSRREHLVIICGRYEGVDERLRGALVNDEISIGDYVLTGGEPAAVVLVDAVARLIPGFLAEEAAANESFSGSLLEHPHYTRPARYRDMDVPPVLLSGDHGAIARWRRTKSIEITFHRRPDLLKGADLSPEEMTYLRSLENNG